MPLIPVALFVAAVVCLGATALLLRSLGSRYRVGRLLAATREVSIDEARELAADAPAAPAYVRVTGRISSEEEFPDEHDRPLVYRRKRIELLAGSRSWRPVSEELEAVPFGIEARSSFIAVDEAAIGAGLVAIPREAVGRTGDLPADFADTGGEAARLGPDTPARLVVEQLSAVEHATVCGMPTLRAGEPTLTAGLGRPLVVTTLAPEDAMRVLAGPYRRRVQAAAALLALSVLLATGALLAGLAGL